MVRSILWIAAPFESAKAFASLRLRGRSRADHRHSDRRENTGTAEEGSFGNLKRLPGESRHSPQCEGYTKRKVSMNRSPKPGYPFSSYQFAASAISSATSGRILKPLMREAQQVSCETLQGPRQKMDWSSTGSSDPPEAASPPPSCRQNQCREPAEPIAHQ
jgi:hypothetical protein